MEYFYYWYVKGKRNTAAKVVGKFSQAIWKHIDITAVGIPDILIWMFYFWKHDVENNYFLVSPEYYLKQAYQKFIFRLNQKFYRDQTQTVFSNVSIFDRVYLEELFGGRESPDGTFVIDYRG